jgi:hypothetical protein
MNPRVFIPQVVLRFNQGLGRLVPVYDFTPASQHGQLTTVLDENDDPDYLSRYGQKVKLALSDFTHEDFLLAVGDPCLIALCSAVIARKNPVFTMLKWQREIRMYVKIEVKV